MAQPCHAISQASFSLKRCFSLHHRALRNPRSFHVGLPNPQVSYIKKDSDSKSHGVLSSHFLGTNWVSSIDLFKSLPKENDRKLRVCTATLGNYAEYTAAFYGIALFGGGLFAYLRTGSKGSLTGGLTGGALLLTSYILMQMGPFEEIGEALGFGTALIFSAVFGIRLFATRKLVPAGALFALSLASAAVFASAYWI